MPELPVRDAPRPARRPWCAPALLRIAVSTSRRALAFQYSDTTIGADDYLCSAHKHEKATAECDSP